MSRTQLKKKVPTYPPYFFSEMKPEIYKYFLFMPKRDYDDKRCFIGHFHYDTETSCTLIKQCFC